MHIKGKSLLFPVKIADTEYVASYSAKLVNGEEQLIITRDCGLYLTDGKGGYTEFKTINAGITLLEVQDLINKLNEKLSKKIDNINTDLDTITNTINQLITDINLKFEGYVTKEDYNKKIAEYDGKIVEYDSNIELLKEKITAETHVNRDVLDKFNVNDNNKLTWNDSILYTEENINALNIKATNIIVDIKNGDNKETKTLQEVLNDILANGIQSQQTRAVCGTAICGTTTCGDL